MTSKIKVDNINKVSDDSNIIKKCGTTTTIGSGASNPIVVDGSAVTLGRCGGTVALASGATQTGFGRTGTVDWQTGSIKTSTFTAANGEGYFANTSGGAFTMNLPAGSAGAIVSVVDYTNTFQTNALTVAANGSEKIGGIAAPSSLSTKGQSVTFVYVDGTEGWKNIQDSTSNVTGNPNLIASVTGSGNTLVTAPCCANVKIATFTGPGNFVVSQASTTAADNIVGYMVVAAGAGAGSSPGSYSGGGGAGGYREGRNVPIDNFTASPLVANAPTNAVTVTAQSYPITIGAGGSGGNPGSVSTFDSITSAGGGKGSIGDPLPAVAAASGGSGGGGSFSSTAGGAGNTPPTTPSQGNNGGTGINTPPSYGSGGGGGAGAVGGNAPSGAGGPGGAGVASSITGSPVTRAGGGGGFAVNSGIQGGTGGPGGGGDGYGPAGPPGTGPGSQGTVNTGGGAGGAAPNTTNNGGSGIVVIRYKFQ